MSQRSERVSTCVVNTDATVAMLASYSDQSNLIVAVKYYVASCMTMLVAG